MSTFYILNSLVFFWWGSYTLAFNKARNKKLCYIRHQTELSPKGEKKGGGGLLNIKCSQNENDHHLNLSYMT